MTRTRYQINGQRKEVVLGMRERLKVVMVIFAFAFIALTGRLLQLGVIEANPVKDTFVGTEDEPPHIERAEIRDRNHELLATSYPVVSLGVRPDKIFNAERAARGLNQIFPEYRVERLHELLTTPGRFRWVRRKLTPAQKKAVLLLGEPGLEFRDEFDRFYPVGRTAAHVVGYTNVDGKGQIGLEKSFNVRLNRKSTLNDPLVTSIDVRLQHILVDELWRGLRRFRATGAAGILLKVDTGEILALASLPDFNPNDLNTVKDGEVNQVTFRNYELGSTLKPLSIAYALDQGVVRLNDRFDTRPVLVVDGFPIEDDHVENYVLSVPEILTHSSNKGASYIAHLVGGDRLRDHYAAYGFDQPLNFEIDEVETPELPSPFRGALTMTASYGHGFSISVAHLATAYATLVNGGRRVNVTLLKQDETYAQAPGPRVISEETSALMRRLLRLVVEEGTGKNARVEGLRIGGKTGTAERVNTDGTRGYQSGSVLTNFAGAFPIEKPEVVMIVMLDKPQGTAETFGFRGAGWNAAQVFKNVATRVAPILGIMPKLSQDEEISIPGWQRISSEPPINVRPETPLVRRVRAKLARNSGGNREKPQGYLYKASQEGAP
ncbi:MAG: penicillin-binding protein 2 [Pseudomonadota bacterium]